jgi:hypothetical protein
VLERAKEGEDKKKMIEKKQNYAKFVKEMHKPNPSERKKLELELLIQNKNHNRKPPRPSDRAGSLNRQGSADGGSRYYAMSGMADKANYSDNEFDVKYNPGSVTGNTGGSLKRKWKDNNLIPRAPEKKSV